MKRTVPVLAVNVPVVPETVPDRMRVLFVPPLRVPLVRVQVPVMVWVRPVPKLRVPPTPLMVRLVALRLPVRVAVPAVLAMVTVPVVEKPAMFWATVPAMVMLELPAVKVPAFVKLPRRVTARLLVLSRAPAPMARAPLTVGAELRVTPPVLLTVRLLRTVAAAGISGPVVTAVAPV